MLAVLISFFMFFVKLSCTMVVANYVHYATFMAARAYQSSEINPDQQLQNAEAVLKETLGNRFKSIIRPDPGAKGLAEQSTGVPGGNVGSGPILLQEDALRYQWNQGVTYAFKALLGFFPFVSARGENQTITISLVSESWAGRETTVEECLNRKKQMGAVAPLLEWDNGDQGC